MIRIFNPGHLLIQAPAKLNLHLHVGRLREDGFHDLLSLFQMVSLYDFLDFQLFPGSGIEIKGDFGFPQEQNIIHKAARAFMDKAGIDKGLVISVQKNIPQGGGMGGGSSNAAAVLAACFFLFPGYLTYLELFPLAESLGSDVPFFLGHAAALVRGRGEILVPVNSRSDYSILVIRPDFSIGTGEAFSLLDIGRKGNIEEKEVTSLKQVRESYESRSPEHWKFTNSFLRFFNNRYPALDLIVKYLYASGSEFSGLTGSGSCVFGVFRERRTAEKVLENAKKEFSYAKIVVPLDINPFHILI